MIDLPSKIKRRKKILKPCRSKTVREVGLDFAVHKIMYHGQVFLLPGKICEGRRKKEGKSLGWESSLLSLDVGEVTGSAFLVFPATAMFSGFWAPTHRPCAHGGSSCRQKALIRVGQC